MVIKSENIGGAFRSTSNSPLKKRKLRSDLTGMEGSPVPSPEKWKSPRRCRISAADCSLNETGRGSNEGQVTNCKSPTKRSPIERSSDAFTAKPKWNPEDREQVKVVKEALHVSTEPNTILCREEEQNRVLEFCKNCIEQQKAGSLYVCGCPGTGKSLLMDRMKQLLMDWVREEGLPQLCVLTVNCTSLINTSDIFSKILGKNKVQKKNGVSTSALQQLQNMYSLKPASSNSNMTLIIADELDYLITKDRAVLHELFMLTTFPFSRFILIGIANAIDLADRFLPRLKSLNCKPIVITFRAYSRDQILKILQERLGGLPHSVFHPLALELCARKVAAASGDMRKALCACRSAIEMLESEIRESASLSNFSLEEMAFSEQLTTPVLDHRPKQFDVVRIDHMAVALSKTHSSPLVDTIRSLPQHQQIILCSAVKLFRGGKKDTTLGELNKSYTDMCKSSHIPPSGILELTNMCRVLNDQGLLKLGQSRDDKSKRITLRVDESDIIFALQGIRFFRNCLQ